MNSSQDKILGSWFGMATGDALGMAVKGLKPETVKQCFGSMGDFKDVRQFIGKGVKRYRMKGLYGITTQRALVVADVILKSKKAHSGVITDLFQKLAVNGPEGYFGSFRQAEAGFFHAVESFSGREPLLPADQNHAGGSYPPLAIAIALFHQKESPEMIRQCLETGLLLSRNPMEIIGTALTGHLTTRFLTLEPDADGDVLEPEISRQILEGGVGACEQAERILNERFLQVDLAADEKLFQAMRLTIQGTLDRWEEEPASLYGWFAENASAYSKNKITQPAQGHVLTLIPLALAMVLKEGKEFAGVLTDAVNRGKESARLGALVGAWAGALYGFDAIPKYFKSGLVNAKEIKSRGEALFQRRAGKGLKDLVEMELALTNKEFEEAKRVTPKKAQKEAGKTASRFDFDEDEFEEYAMPKKEEVAKWRKFQKDKTKMKRDRRRNLNVGFEPDEADEE
jgi:ADP-ribosylglycohydrolase